MMASHQIVTPVLLSLQRTKEKIDNVLTHYKIAVLASLQYILIAL